MARISALAAALLLAALLGTACGPADRLPDPTPAEAPTPTDAGAIRQLDLLKSPPVQALIRQVGGGDVDPREIIYADLTQDGREEAIVPVSSGGTLGNLGYVVLALRSGSPVAILTVLRDRNTVGAVSLRVEDGQLVKTIGKYAPEDPFCCPSTLIRTVYYWDGSNLQVQREEEVKVVSTKQ
ncbi:MAG TPA: hypothetical protein VNN10_05175 [Dehalococcoidia bacterium]|nr:hypothetical protein [Dehalococcoidia bacterium]